VAVFFCGLNAVTFAAAGGQWIQEESYKKLKPVSTSVETGFCSPQNEIKLTPC
jgi:hypothetical protein